VPHRNKRTAPHRRKGDRRRSIVRVAEDEVDGMSYGDYVEQLTYLLFL
jgi:hypothetical protein